MSEFRHVEGQPECVVGHVHHCPEHDDNRTVHIVDEDGVMFDLVMEDDS